MTSTFSTIVNCSVLDALRKLENIQLLSDINAIDLKSEEINIHFPRTRFLNASNEKQQKSYVIDTIQRVVKEARKDAWHEMKQLDINVSLAVAYQFQVDFQTTTSEDLFDDIDAEDVRKFEAVIEDEINSDDEDIQVLSENPNLPEFVE